ncbi:MAG: hypothetical protein ACFFCW_01525 [Candidatus Hodarchaeota archaeon]
MINEQQSPDQPEDREPERSVSEENEQELQRRILEKRKKLRELEQELDKEIEESGELLRERRRTRPDTDEDVGSRFEVRIEQAAEGLERTIGNYVSSILDSVADGMEGALDGLFSASTLHKTRRKMDKARRKAEKLQRKAEKLRRAYQLTEEELKAFPEESAQILQILADANRLKILQELEIGADYQKDLSERTDIKGGQWKHHTDALKEAKFIDQEVDRGRYRITLLGREALKLAEMLYIRKKASDKKSNSDYDEVGDDQDDFEVPIE